MIAGAGILALSAGDPACANGPILGAPPPPPTPAPMPPLPPPPIAAPAPPPPPILVPGYNWSGFYIGGNLGGGWSNTDTIATRSLTIDNLAPVTASTGLSSSGGGIIGGGHFGFNYQIPSWVGGLPNNWVVGIEADLDAADITHSNSNCFQTAQGIVFSCASGRFSIDDFGTVRGRLGYAFDNVLVYGTGGWAWGDTSATIKSTCLGTGCPANSLPITQPSVHGSSNPDGWSAGAGIELGLLPNWSIRAEYLHLQFDGIGFNASFVGTIPGGLPVSASGNLKTNLGVDIARVGLTYRFNLF